MPKITITSRTGSTRARLVSLDQLRRSSCEILLVALVAIVSFSPAMGQVELVGSVVVPGNTTDRSGLGGSVGNGTPHNLFAAISSIDHLGGNRYLAMPDRGPLDGASQFQCRIHEIELAVVPNQPQSASIRILKTSLLTTEDGKPLVGALEAFDPIAPAKGLRFDPEGVRASPSGSFFASDEYGPFLYEFKMSGARIRAMATPPEFSIAHPSADPKQEDRNNTRGRAANSGWEGLAISPDGNLLTLAIQKSLLQDRLVDVERKLPSKVVRLLQIDLRSGNTRQFACLLEDASNGISEILAVSQDEFLILERDGLPGVDAKTKRVYRIDTKGATDVSASSSLAGIALPADVVPVQKSLLVDLLDPRWGFVGEHMPEKWEGLAFGPRLPDGRRVLWVAVDNDYVLSAPTYFHAFAISPDMLPPE